MDDVFLVKKCLLGDIDAFESLVERYQRGALRTAYLITNRKELAEDIVQEAFVQCYLNLKRLQHPERFQAWLYRIVTRLSWRMLSKEKKHISLRNIGDLPDREYGENTRIWGNMQESREYQDLQECLYNLSKQLRTTVILYYFHGYSLQEIAEILGCPPGTVKSRLHTARKRLAKELGAAHEEVLNDDAVGKKAEGAFIQEGGGN